MSNSIDNNKLIVDLFNYKRSLTIEQEDIERVVNYHIDLFNSGNNGCSVSQKDIVKSLSEKLNKFAYDNTVKSILENVNVEIDENSLFYELEDLYRKLENSNQGEIYRHTMQVVLDILNESSDKDKMAKIFTNLKLYEWIPAVKQFIWKYTASPKDRLNMSSQGGQATSVYSIVEKIENGFLTYVGDRWFILSENLIEPTQPVDHIADMVKVQRLLLLETALKIGTIDADKISFEVDEDTTIGIDFKNGAVYLNEKKCDKNTTLESIFESPIISFIRKDVFPVIKECQKNIDKFVELDVVQKISNITEPFLECFAFNYKENMYLYSMDRRLGNTFFQYESATLLVNEMRDALGIDLSMFYKNKFDGETKFKMELEDKKKFVISKLSEINENLFKLEDSGLLESSEEVKIAHISLGKEKNILENKLELINDKLSNEFKKTV